MENKAYDYRVDMVATGKRIKALREQKKISMNRMVDFFGLTRQAMYKWERGESLPEIETFFALSELLQVSIGDILVGVRKVAIA